jgi:hypothetical protein
MYVHLICSRSVELDCGAETMKSDNKVTIERGADSAESPFKAASQTHG